MAKIKNLAIENFRGSRKKVELHLNGVSSLIYGDNGSGKSSFVDGAEWFFHDSVSHLTGEEVGARGGLRNSHCSDTEESYFEIELTTTQEKSRKHIKVEKDKFKIELSEVPTELKTLTDKVSTERLILRNTQLVEFIIASKTERLEEISGLIGFDSIQRTKTVLKKSLNDIKGIIKQRNFSGSIDAEKQILLQQMNILVNTEEQFISACNTLLARLDLNLKISTIADLRQIEETLREGVDQQQTRNLQNLEQYVADAEKVSGKLLACRDKWLSFEGTLTKLTSDVDRLKKINLSKLLSEAQTIISSATNDNCPLCLQGISIAALKESVLKRIQELKGINSEITNLESAKRTFVEEFDECLNEFSKLCMSAKAFLEPVPLEKLTNFGKELRVACKHLGETSMFKITNKPDWTSLNEVSKLIVDNISVSAGAAKSLKEKLNSPRVEIATKLALGKSAFDKITTLKNAESILIKQRETFEIITSDLNRRQKDGMSVFLDAISADVNELYLFMHGADKIEGIRLVCLSDEATGEFQGIALALKFHGKEVYAPKKYLSESYLNSLGLCLFLASVKKFNKVAKFFILDDVISSFDRNHRMRFGQLLAEKFPEHQIIVFTHETEWYEFLASLVKRVGWGIYRLFWNITDGIYFDAPPSTLKEQIVRHIEKNNESDLGNTVRRYAERLLKDICVEIEAPVAFRLNDRNESRQFDELYSAVRARLRDKSPTTAALPEVVRLAACQFLTNKGSHDNAFKPGIEDLKAAYKDLNDFESIFVCVDCEKQISVKYPDVPGKKLSCRCGKLKLDWKSPSGNPAEI